MKNLLLCLLVMCLLSCSNKKGTSFQMTSFEVLDQKTFKMCFTDDVEGIYALVIKTKSGQEIKKAGRLTQENQNCFQELKMQHAADSYTTAQTRFYQDSLVNQNIASVKWMISRRYYEEPMAEGEFVPSH